MIDHQPAPGDQSGNVEAQRGDVGGKILSPFLEAHEHAGFIELLGTIDQEGHGQQGLAAAGAAADQGRSPRRQPTYSYVVEPVNAGRRFDK